MKGFYTILLLIVSNVFMTFAWYGHLKMKQEYSWFAALPLIGVIAFSWAIAFFEYSCQIPANRIGFIGNGGCMRYIGVKEAATKWNISERSVRNYCTNIKVRNLLPLKLSRGH